MSPYNNKLRQVPGTFGRLFVRLRQLLRQRIKHSIAKADSQQLITFLLPASAAPRFALPANELLLFRQKRASALWNSHRLSRLLRPICFISCARFLCLCCLISCYIAPATPDKTLKHGLQQQQTRCAACWKGPCAADTTSNNVCVLH